MKLRVRVAQKTKLKGFRRCGLEFSREWAEVDVEDAVGRRLMAEQMLETVPAPESEDKGKKEKDGLQSLVVTPPKSKGKK